MNKITKATFKSFIKKNKDKLYYKKLSDFDGMVDCVMPIKGEWMKVDNYNKLLNNDLGWLVGNGRDYFSSIENGIEVYNSCGSFQVKTINRI